ncbi:uncharacterized protein CC84DRAFT_652033 [Paraphaeosphaeria sporulosa]|uniref:Uncharacterized protein n=1 Tax=Paraphaeosphaeria sporulosa TaxID=1460663 RepID=A0A177CIC8_9PLEO|nr:uncharacterized protein CC84DRAFT_652033 [Paraphaeosphaeria sporulosa]OAG07274.1 hypothetical protein CC84DRAFT_652033 [Paraphaeosphaeria sporulosa]
MSSALSSSAADGVGDTTLFIATADSYTSDGPTLPIIGGAGEHSDWVAPDPEDRQTEKDALPRPAKKQRAKDDLSKDSTNPEATSKKSKVQVEGLYQPWTLLPVEVLQQVEKRVGREWRAKAEVVVWTKNQNVKSGINRLKSLLGFEEAPETGEKSGREVTGNRKDKLIAVSAYGEGTTKLVGIVEMTKRVVDGATKDSSGVTWFMYTVLSSTTEKDVKNKAPVLTVWLSPTRIPELNVTFGEQTFKVKRTTGVD